MENLQELKAIPHNAKPRVKVGNTTFYGSKELDEKFIDAVRSQPITNPVWKKLAELIESGVVNPCFLSQGIFSFLVNKIFSPGDDQGTLGFFSPKTKKIYIVVDNWAGILGNAPDEGISRTLLHECIHLFADSNHNDFLSMFKDDLARFYGEMLTRYFRVSKYDLKEMQDLTKFIFNEYEISTKDTFSFKEYWERIEKLFMKKSSFRSSDFDYSMRVYFTMIKFLFTNIGALRQYYTSTFRDLYIAMYRGYQSSLNISPNGTLLVQELVYPSEIICVIASHGTKGQLSKLYTAINKI